MNSAQIKSLSVFAVFALIGFGPISPGCLIGMYIVVMRPDWFWQLVKAMYDYPQPATLISVTQSRTTRIKCFASLFTLFIIDILPVPVTPVVAFVIILSRPEWFYQVVGRVYGENLQ